MLFVSALLIICLFFYCLLAGSYRAWFKEKNPGELYTVSSWWQRFFASS